MSNIARRTRSHLSIDDDVINNDRLDFPDVDANLYQNPSSVSDHEYKDFLYKCYSEAVEQGTDTNTDDNDPAYVYNDDIFSHGWKFNVFEGLPQQQHHHQHQLDQLQQLQQPSTLGESNFGSEFARILDQQLRQHIQLLSQSYLLARAMKQTQDEADELKEHLNSYNRIFHDRRKPANLLPAIELVNQFGIPKELKSSIRLSWRHLPVPEPVKAMIEQNRDVFPYVDLLPRVAFSRLPDKLVKKRPKSEFTLNEDKLLALALDEFKGETAQYAYIASLLLPAKTKTQIGDHIKNMKRKQGPEDNPIRLYFASGRLPHVDLDSNNRLRDSRSSRKPDHAPPAHQQELQVCLARQQHDEQQEHQQQQQLEEHDARQSQDVEQGVVVDQHHFKDIQGPVVNPTQEPQEDQQQYQTMDVDDDCSLAGETMNMDDLMTASTTISKHNNVSERSIKSQKIRKTIIDLIAHKFSMSEEAGNLIVEDFLKASRETLSQRNYMSLLQLLADAKKFKDPVKIYKEISTFLKKIEAPLDIRERFVLFLSLETATECECGPSYLHWLRTLQFIQHVEMYHESDGIEKKLGRLVDAIQKGDNQKVKSAAANLINKHPLLKREYEALALDGKPHTSLFIYEEDFDDQTEPFALFDSNQEDCSHFEHFEHKLTTDEMNYASQLCPCKCHQGLVKQEQQQHCERCNLKLMKGRMYLVNKKKPCLAEWTYIDRQPDPAPSQRPEWTFEEDKVILEFCQAKSRQGDESLSFDTPIFEGLVRGKSAAQIAERFNYLYRRMMEMCMASE